jgi:hypothetical protein
MKKLDAKFYGLEFIFTWHIHLAARSEAFVFTAWIMGSWL